MKPNEQLTRRHRRAGACRRKRSCFSAGQFERRIRQRRNATCHAADEPRRDERPTEPGRAVSGARLDVQARPACGGERPYDRPKGHNRSEPVSEGRADRSAQSNEKKGTTAGNNESQTGKATQERNKGAAESERPSRSNAAQERERTGGNRTGGETNMNAQRGRIGTEGLQGNATGMNVQLDEQQRNEIRTTVLNGRGAPRVSNVDFDVTVGTVIPRGRIHVVPVPETLVRIEPEWRGFLYFVYEDEVVVVNPRDMKIVAVVPA